MQKSPLAGGQKTANRPDESGSKVQKWLKMSCVCAFFGCFWNAFLILFPHGGRRSCFRAGRLWRNLEPERHREVRDQSDCRSLRSRFIFSYSSPEKSEGWGTRPARASYRYPRSPKARDRGHPQPGLSVIETGATRPPAEEKIDRRGFAFVGSIV
jgi:hypothetical protein